MRELRQDCARKATERSVTELHSGMGMWLIVGSVAVVGVGALLWYVSILLQSGANLAGDEVISGIDALYLSLDRPTNHMVINGVFFFEGRQSAAAVRRHMEEHVLHQPHYRKLTRVATHVPDQMDSSRSYYWSWRSWTRLPFLLPKWQPYANFRVEDHVEEVDLRGFYNKHCRGSVASEGGRGAEEADEMKVLQRVLGFLSSQPMDKSKPMWHDYLFHLSSGDTVMLSRIHHSISDGIGLVNYTLDVTETIDEENAYISGLEGKKDTRKGNSDGKEIRDARKESDTQKRQRSSMSRIWEMAKFASGLPMAYLKFHVKLADPQTFLTPSKPLTLQKRVAWLQPPLPLEEVKEVSSAYDGTINDLLVTVTAMALAKYAAHMGERGPLPPIRAFVPVGNALAKNRSLNLENQFGFVYLGIPTHIKEPAAALASVKAQMDAMKANPADMLFSYLYTRYTGDIAAPIGLKIGTEYFSSRCSLVFTNVRGPGRKVAFAGVPVKEMCFFVPQAGNLALGISIFSYAGGVSIGVNCDATRVSDPDLLLDCCRSAFADLAITARMHTKRE